MPKVTRQRPNDRPRDDGSVLGGAIEIGDIEEVPIKICLYGQNRVGKTTLACLFPKPLLLVSFEPTRSGGAQSVKRYAGVKYLHLSSTRDAMKLADELKRRPPSGVKGFERQPFESVVIDSATSLQDVILKELLDLPAVPEQLNWGTVSQDQYRERSEKCREMLRPFIDLPCHTVVNAKERDHNANKEERNRLLRSRQEHVESFFAADLGGATAGWLHDACDYVARLMIVKEIVKRTTTVKVLGKTKTKEVEEETGRSVRRLRTMYHPNMAAGFRSADPDCVPEHIEAETPEEMYRKIRDVIAGKRIEEKRDR